ncbi:MAG: riboflavin synthase [Cytophagales bacterium]|nr:riboflavin synthase [Cytophagales bacterium]
MFTGIVEAMSTIKSILQAGTNYHFEIQTSLAAALKIDQSVAHNGVCLTVVDVASATYKVTAVDETLQRTNLGTLKPGDYINLERCLPANGRLEGHVVQGHVDQVGVCTAIEEKEGSWLFQFTYAPNEASLIVEKGSITVNGVSLTCFNTTANTFTIAIIPYTFRHTNFQYLKVGDRVNLEFDIIGKYVKLLLEKRNDV